MDLRYPIGECDYPQIVSRESREQHIEVIAAAPARLRDAINGLTDQQLDTPYRPEGWTVRQVVHHFADSHMNAYVRFKLALTEEEPTIKTYDEKRWAELKDARSGPLDPSLQLIEGLHRRWVASLELLSDADFERPLRHPELGVLRLDTYLAAYSWHCRHHTAHITSLRRRMAW
jgi:hypothetical protein